MEREREREREEKRKSEGEKRRCQKGDLAWVESGGVGGEARGRRIGRWGWGTESALKAFGS